MKVEESRHTVPVEEYLQRDTCNRQQEVRTGKTRDRDKTGKRNVNSGGLFDIETE